MNSRKTIIMMGLPAAGKTSFLAAFWYHVKHSQNHRLHIDALPEDLEYLNLISGLWLEGKQQPHTNCSTRVEMRLRQDPAQEATLVCLPDTSGETYQRHWTDRQWDFEYDSLARTVTGLVVFIHPQHAGQSPLIADVNAGAAALGSEGPAPSEPRTTAAPWDSKSAPADVMLVDCLQFLICSPCFHEHLFVSIVISAWDTVEALEKTPHEWFHSEMPMLAQFCQCNQERLRTKCYGISAQGGKYDDETSVALILKQRDPLKRARAIAADGKTIDITAPVAWLLDSEIGS